MSRLTDEHYAHLLGQAAGLSDVTSEMFTADDVGFLAIQRFDRVVSASGEVVLIHQEDAAQTLGLDWCSPDAKFQDHHWLNNPARASAARVAQPLGADPCSGSLLRDLVHRMVFSVVLGDNDAHAKNFAVLHTNQGTAVAPPYDVVPNLFARDMIGEGFRMAFAVNGSFDHRQVSVGTLISEIGSWGLLTDTAARTVVQDAIVRCAEAVGQVIPPGGISDGLVDKLSWTVDRLVAGEPIGVSPWQAGKIF